MGTTYTHSLDVGEIALDFDEQTIVASSAVDSLGAQDLVDAIRNAEESIEGRSFGAVANIEGKFVLDNSDPQNVIVDAIKISLLDSWTIGSAKTTGRFVLAANVNRNDGGWYFDSNPTVDYRNLAELRGVVTTVTSGSGLSTEQDARLTATSEKVEEMHGFGGYLAGAAAVLTNLGSGAWSLVAGTRRMLITSVGDPTETGHTTTHERDDP